MSRPDHPKTVAHKCMVSNLINVIHFLEMLEGEKRVDYPERRIESHHMAVICTRNQDRLSM